MSKYTSKSGLDNKYYYIETWKNLLNILNKKKSIRILDL